MFLQNNQNSCYINSYFTVLYNIIGIKKLDKYFFNKPIHVKSDKLKRAILGYDINKVRKLFAKTYNDDSWLHEQKEPLDVVNALKDFFEFPKTVIIRESFFGKKKQTDKCEMYINENILKKDMNCKFVQSVEDIKVTDEETDIIDYPSNGLYLDKYVQLKHISKIIGCNLLNIHINRIVGNEKLYYYVDVPNKICCSKLKGIIVHKGNVNSGHYVSYVLIDKKWYLYDDLDSEPVVVPRLKKSVFKKCTDLIYYK